MPRLEGSYHSDVSSQLTSLADRLQAADRQTLMGVLIQLASRMDLDRLRWLLREWRSQVNPRPATGGRDDA